MNPDERLFKSHLEEASYQLGVDNGFWDIVEISWPIVYLWIAAAAKKNSPDKYYFKFTVDGYSDSAPSACPWDIEKKSVLPLNEWPKGRNHVSKVFNPQWKQDALYAPCDRAAMDSGHQNWKTQHPELWWQSHFKITVYLRFLRELLISDDYKNS